MSGDDVSVEKVAFTIPVSDETVASATNVTAMYSELLSRLLGRDDRTDEQKAADAAARREWDKAQRASRAGIRAHHSALLASAEPFRRALLELHAPVFGSETDGDGHCEGCDAEGYECESPRFPCRTYELAADALTPVVFSSPSAAATVKAGGVATDIGDDTTQPDKTQR